MKICRTEEQHFSDEVIEQILHVKDRFNISNEAYHEMAMVNKQLPRACTVLKVAKKIDAQANIQSTPGELSGVQQSLKERLEKRIRFLGKIVQTLERVVVLKLN